MEQKIVLVQAINLLYWSSLLEVKTNDAGTLVEEVLSTMRLPEATLESDTNREILVSLRATALHLAKNDNASALDRITLLQRIRVNVKDDQGLYDAFALSIEESTDAAHIQKRYLHYSAEIGRLRREKELKDKLKKLLSELVYGATEDFDVRDVATKFITEMEPYSVEKSAQGLLGLRGVVGVVDFDDDASINETFDMAIRETSTEGIIRLGWQSINKMTGWHQGLRRGDEVVVGALQHNYKSGFTTHMTRHAFQYNKPFMLDPNKKPMILHISSENALTDNLMFMYQSVMENITKEPCDISNIDKTEASKWLRIKASENGYTLKMIRVNPSEFGYRDLFNLVLQCESEGYEIHMVTVDYLNMMSKEGCAQGPAGTDTRDLFRRVRNFMAPKKILFVTPHQLSSQAKDLIRQGVPSLVKEVANKGYWDSCRVIDQEYDLGFIINKVVIAGRSYLEIHRDKHRKSGMVTPEQDLYAVLPFSPIAGIPDDINDVDRSISKPGADLKGDLDGGSDENSWYIAA